MSKTERTTPAPESATPCPRMICVLDGENNRDVRPCRLEEGHEGVCKVEQPVTDPAEFEEDDDYARRVALGLRPIFLAHEHTHPDEIPCPAWCWRADQPTGSHDVAPQRPRWSWHTSESISVAWEAKTGGQYKEGIALSTLDLRLQGWRDREPTIRLQANPAEDDRPGPLVLTLEDARELAVVLLHLIDQETTTDG